MKLTPEQHRKAAQDLRELAELSTIPEESDWNDRLQRRSGSRDHPHNHRAWTQKPGLARRVRSLERLRFHPWSTGLRKSGWRQKTLR